MNPTLEIFSQGEEVVTGQTVDTNAAWLSEQVVSMGFSVTRHTVVGDKLDDLISLLREISIRADCCICTGGLGPTSDDLTAEAVAKAFDLPLEFDAVAFEQIKRFFTLRNRAMPESNRKQAMFPKGAERIDNTWGTAPGFSLKAGRCWFAFVPGVPMEMRHLFLESIQPTLASRFLLRPGKLITIKTLGIGESAIQEVISAIEIPAQVQLGFRASPDDVQTKLLFPPDYPEAAMT
ncbi:MAG: competence/damage-inducible protein A, partial [Methylobacter sp.]